MNVSYDPQTQIVAIKYSGPVLVKVDGGKIGFELEDAPIRVGSVSQNVNVGRDAYTAGNNMVVNRSRGGVVSEVFDNAPPVSTRLIVTVPAGARIQGDGQADIGLHRTASGAVSFI